MSLPENYITAINNAVAHKRQLDLGDNKICVLYEVNWSNNTIYCKINNKPTIIQISDILKNDYKLVEAGKEKAKSLIERINIVKQRRAENLGEALETEGRYYVVTLTVIVIICVSKQ